MFYSCDLFSIIYFFRALIFAAEEWCGTFARMSECGAVLQRRSEGVVSVILYPLHFEGRKSANFAEIFRQLRHFQAL